MEVLFWIVMIVVGWLASGLALAWLWSRFPVLNYYTNPNANALEVEMDPQVLRAMVGYGLLGWLWFCIFGVIRVFVLPADLMASNARELNEKLNNIYECPGCRMEVDPAIIECECGAKLMEVNEETEDIECVAIIVKRSERTHPEVKSITESVA